MRVRYKTGYHLTSSEFSQVRDQHFSKKELSPSEVHKEEVLPLKYLLQHNSRIIFISADKPVLVEI